ncbi:hypothetical protein DFH06DRAFT_1313217 [Mycena polygramma]|nr:hypothetical protein DFH06DRAFT_1313217 [Mycena polygramma]
MTVQRTPPVATNYNVESPAFASLQPPFPGASDAFKIYNSDADYTSGADQHYYNFRYGDTAFFVLEEAPGTMLGETQPQPCTAGLHIGQAD